MLKFKDTIFYLKFSSDTNDDLKYIRQNSKNRSSFVINSSFNCSSEAIVIFI